MLHTILLLLKHDEMFDGDDGLLGLRVGGGTILASICEKMIMEELVDKIARTSGSRACWCRTPVIRVSTLVHLYRAREGYAFQSNIFDAGSHYYDSIDKLLSLFLFSPLLFAFCLCGYGLSSKHEGIDYFESSNQEKEMRMLHPKCVTNLRRELRTELALSVSAVTAVCPAGRASCLPASKGSGAIALTTHRKSPQKTPQNVSIVSIRYGCCGPNLDKLA